MTSIAGNMENMLDIMPSMLYTADMKNLQVGNRLKVARAERNLSQEDLAKLAGVTRQTISSIETGQYCPSTLLALTLSRCFDKPVEELFFLKEAADV